MGVDSATVEAICKLTRNCWTSEEAAKAIEILLEWAGGTVYLTTLYPLNDYV